MTGQRSRTEPTGNTLALPARRWAFLRVFYQEVPEFRRDLQALIPRAFGGPHDALEQVSRKHGLQSVEEPSWIVGELAKAIVFMSVDRLTERFRTPSAPMSQEPPFPSMRTWEADASDSPFRFEHPGYQPARTPAEYRAEVLERCDRELTAYLQGPTPEEEARAKALRALGLPSERREGALKRWLESGIKEADGHFSEQRFRWLALRLGLGMGPKAIADAFPPVGHGSVRRALSREARRLGLRLQPLKRGRPRARLVGSR